MNDALNELAPLKQWVAFRKVPKNGEISKPPINIHTGKAGILPKAWELMKKPIPTLSCMTA